MARYQLTEELASDSRYRLSRGRLDGHAASVLIKEPVREPGCAADRAGLACEYDILRALQIDGVARPLALLEGSVGCALVLEDAGARTLADVISGGPPPLGWVLDYATQLIGILRQLHAADVVYRGLTPQGILVQRSGRVELVDFSEALRNAVEACAPFAPGRYGTRLRYCAPEQTGRISRGCDYRTDFYALGALLYELVTGRAPFEEADPLALIHAHIARMPTPPAELSAAVPQPVSQIVMKLLAKPAEERYQSAAALERDLRRCRSEWAEFGRILPFPIGVGDVSDRFTVPQRLYGRSAELARACAVFDRICDPGARPMLLLVSGYAGVGKTALIGELQAHVSARRGNFAAGKFDQLSRDVPYEALLQALRQLIQRSLTEPPAELSRQRDRLAAALGPHAGVVAEVVPELELVLGRQPAPPRLAPTEARNRFNLAFQHFLAAMASPERPLAIVLDDLQWADAATLQLLETLLRSPDLRNVLLIGAFRDNEVDADHPLTASVLALERLGVALQRMQLKSLGLPALTQMMADTLHSPVDAPGSQAQALGALLLAKTDGNPFFVLQFLQTLRKDKLIAYDSERSAWCCDLAAVALAPITSNVIDLMSRKIDMLAPATRCALALAAFLGNRFEAQTLATVTDQSVEATLEKLVEAVAEGLIVPEAVGAFRFLHDRVQQAAYACIADADKPRMHLRVGRLLLARRRQYSRQIDFGEATGEGLFDFVSHLNLGAALIDAPEERLSLARLNLAAGNRAKSSAAFSAALGYFKAGVDLLADDWQPDPELAFALHLELAQCEYLCGNFERAEQLYLLLLQRSPDDLERVRVHNLRMVQCENRARYSDALACARKGLALFGVALPQADGDKQRALNDELAAIERAREGRPVAHLSDLPTMSDPAIRRVMALLTGAWSPAYILGDGLLARLMSATLVRLSLQHGNTEESAYGYVTHAITVGPVLGDYDTAWEFGKLALQINEKFNDVARRAKIQQQFHAHVNLWRQPFASCVPYAREATRCGLETGDFLYAAYGAATESWPAFAAARDLAHFIRDLTPNLALLQRLRNDSFADALLLMLQWARALRGETAAPLSLSGADFDETAYVDRYRDNPFFSMFHAVACLQLRYVFDDHASALQNVHAVQPAAQQLIGMIWSVWFDFWGGLTLAACIDRAPAGERSGWVEQMRTSQRSLAALAQHCPENYRCMALLLDGEIERADGSPLAAVECFEQAIDYAERSHAVQHVALGNELCARLWLRRGNRRVAALYLRAARSAYAAWGARAKVAQLNDRYGELLEGASSAMVANESAPADSLDIGAVGKAALAIAGHIDVNVLLRQMLKIMLQHAGATRGLLIESGEDQLTVIAEADAEAARVTLLTEALAVDGSMRCSRAIVNFVQRTRASLVLADPVLDERFNGDDYLVAERPRAILCLPGLQQGRSGVIVYLENHLDRDAFGADRVEVTQLLAGQLATSLESARLFSRVKQEITDRQRAEQALRAIEAGTATVTGGDFFRALVRNLAQALQVRYVFVAECLTAEDGSLDAPATGRARTRAYWKGDHYGADFDYRLAGTPCREVVEGRLCHHANDLQGLFPDDRGLVDLGAQSYVGTPLIGSTGRVIGHLVVLDTQPLPDATIASAVLKVCAGRAGAELERLKAEEGLKRAIAQVEQLKNRLQEENVYLRRELIANVSHDLRSPLASLRGYLDTLLLKEDSLSAAERGAYLGIAVRQAEHLQALISELFDLAKLDFQGYQIAPELLHPGELARDVLQKFQLAADAQKISLQIDAQPDVGFVNADISLIERTLENLIENALAHTPAGGAIRVQVATREGQVTLRVSDSGCGIPPADLPHVFERFYRVDKSRGRNAKGAGLGLAIVKRIVELHQSEICVESGPAGTAFWFALPAIAPLAEQPLPAAA